MKKKEQPQLKPGQRHFAFERCRLSPPSRPRVRLAFQPFKINPRLFMVDKIRPYPEWPLICKATNFMAFASEKDAKNFSEKTSPQGSIFKMWLCEHCKMTHFEPYPLEVSGQSSGKALRKNAFATMRKAAEVEEVDDE
jgi:hypothetical protein